jgi:hypothetical protein
MERNTSSLDPAPSTVACERIRRPLEHGAPWDACDAFREEIAKHPGDPELLYWGGCSCARRHWPKQAHARSIGRRPLRRGSQRFADILNLRGRLWGRVPSPGPRRCAADSRARAREYLAAYALQRDPYPGINASTISMLLGDRAEARRLAEEIAARLGQSTPQNCWDHATAGEAHLLLGQLDQARQCYAAAYAAAPNDAGSVATMRRQVNLLVRVIPEAAEVLQLLPAPDVVAFAGHMIDLPGRKVPRFPSALVPAVEAVLRERLARLHEPVVYPPRPRRGPDLHRGRAERGAEVNRRRCPSTGRISSAPASPSRRRLDARFERRSARGRA